VWREEMKTRFAVDSTALPSFSRDLSYLSLLMDETYGTSNRLPTPQR